VVEAAVAVVMLPVVFIALTREVGLGPSLGVAEEAVIALKKEAHVIGIGLISGTAV